MKTDNKQYQFILDLNKCIGCNACVTGCKIVNNQSTSKSWRSITSFNNNKLPGIQFFNNSMACNHCDNAPCMKYCPANAFYRNKDSGAVIINQDKCIGCAYCTWNCPYDAPFVDTNNGVAEKCHFCSDRINSDINPACVNACVTGALSIDCNAKTGVTISNTYGINPNIRVIPKINQDGPEIFEYPSEEAVKLITENKQKPKQKITPIKEWPLLIFTLLISLLGSLYLGDRFFDVMILDPFFYTIGILSSGIVSLFHLGKKTRAWRSLLNLKNSWLSREIAAFTLFSVFSVTDLYLGDTAYFKYLSFCSLILLSISIDMIYNQTRNRYIWHTGTVSFAILTLSSLLFDSRFIALVILSLGLILYLYRNLIVMQDAKFQVAVIMRSVLGFLIPIALIVINTNNIVFLLWTLVFAGIIIDRIQFYREIFVITPEIQNELDLNVIRYNKMKIK